MQKKRKNFPNNLIILGAFVAGIWWPQCHSCFSNIMALRELFGFISAKLCQSRWNEKLHKFPLPEMIKKTLEGHRLFYDVDFKRFFFFFCKLTTFYLTSFIVNHFLFLSPPFPIKCFGWKNTPELIEIKLIHWICNFISIHWARYS